MKVRWLSQNTNHRLEVWVLPLLDLPWVDDAIFLQLVRQELRWPLKFTLPSPELVCWKLVGLPGCFLRWQLLFINLGQILFFNLSQLWHFLVRSSEALVDDAEFLLRLQRLLSLPLDILEVMMINV